MDHPGEAKGEAGEAVGSPTDPTAAETQKAADAAADAAEALFNDDKYKQAFDTLTKDLYDTTTPQYQQFRKNLGDNIAKNLKLKIDDPRIEKVLGVFDDISTETQTELGKNKPYEDALRAAKKTISDKMSKNPNYSGGEDFADYTRKTGANLADLLKQFNGDLHSKLLENFKKVGLDTTMPNSDYGANGKKFNDALKKIYDGIDGFSNDESFRELEEKWTKNQNLADANEGKTTGKEPLKLKDFMKALSAFLLVGGSIFGIFALVEYCIAHSGCNYVYRADDIMEEEHEKLVCSSTPNIISYSAEICHCNTDGTTRAAKTTPKPTDCSTSKTEPSVEYIKTNSSAVDSKSNKKYSCQTDLTKFPYSYYTYTVMTPIDALFDIGSRSYNAVAGAGEGLLKLLIKICKYVGIGIASLLIMYLIYSLIKHFLNKSKTVKSETVKFGTKGQYRLKIDSAIPVSRIKQYKFGRYRNY